MVASVEEEAHSAAEGRVEAGKYKNLKFSILNFELEKVVQIENLKLKI